MQVWECVMYPVKIVQKHNVSARDQKNILTYIVPLHLSTVRCSIIVYFTHGLKHGREDTVKCNTRK